MKSFYVIFCILFFSAVPVKVWSLIRWVPAEYATIQQAIDACDDHDTVIVSPGTYTENINFKGKLVYLGSEFTLNHDPFIISNTIINGNYPANPDTASCVLFINGEDSTAVIEGFTVTGGSGTKWLDEHGAGTYREGGAILIQYSSPTIKNNIITFNNAGIYPGCVSTGGGAIRSGDSNPHIMNNLITHNYARYGGGIVLNYSGALIRNNIIAYNWGGEDYGGGGIWSNGNGQDPIIIENNTVVYNQSGSTGGGIRFWQSNASVPNNIIWGNTAANNWPQIQGYGGTVTWSDVEGGWTGEGNINADPVFTTPLTSFTLDQSSPCKDTGNALSEYNDPEDPNQAGMALWPSIGTIRNDMGAFGGPGRSNSPFMWTGDHENFIKNYPSVKAFPNPAADKLELYFPVNSTGHISLFDPKGLLVLDFNVGNQDRQSLDVSQFTPGIYSCRYCSNEILSWVKILIIH